MKPIQHFLLRSALAAAALVPVLAQAQSYPTAPVKVVVPWPAGGVVDAAMRVITEKLPAGLGQPVVVDNRPGANGIIGSTLVATAPADGHTLLVTSAETVAINPHAYAKISYDAKRDFAPIMSLVKLQHVLATRSTWPQATVAETVQAIRQQPDKFTYASWGIGSVPQVGMEMLNGKAGLKLLHVPFNGGPQAFNGLIAGQVDLMILPTVAAKPLKDSGRIKVLAVASAERSPLMPDVPTLKESGLDVEVPNTLGIVAPAKTPPAVLKRLNDEITRVLAQPEVQATLKNLGAEIFVLDRDKFGSYADQERAAWGEVITRANIKLQ